MEIVVKGRNIEVPDHYRVHVTDKVRKIERYDHKLIRTDIELFHERNPRQSDHCQRVEITCFSRGPVVRAEASAKTFYTALDIAVNKLDYRLRKAADRRRVHRGRHTPTSVAAATAALASVAARPSANGASGPVAATERTPDDGPGKIVREKEHAGGPMTIDDALFEMELVGHDFYLFLDRESGRPSVVYRRKGYDYGVIRLAT
ncbi:MAG TPA: ribosome-associated translation inhibitor RaiA [Micromonosporaceae bacterium]